MPATAPTLRILLFSTLFPSAVRPIHGIFDEIRLRELIKTGRVQAKVIAPVPWFSWAGERFGDYGLFAATPRFEQRNGLAMYHPRYLLPPKVGMNITPTPRPWPPCWPKASANPLWSPPAVPTSTSFPSTPTRASSLCKPPLRPAPPLASARR